MMITRQHNSLGFTLIEMIIVIVVLGSAVSGIMFADVQNVSKSADPMIQQQAIIIARLTSKKLC